MSSLPPSAPLPASVAQFLGVKVRADGTFDFAGHVSAKGVDLAEGANAIPSVKERWLDGAGAERESLYGMFKGGLHQLMASVTGAGADRVILNDAEQSDFLQLLATAKVLVQVGTRAAVVSDAGGWCHYVLPNPFQTAVDGVLAMNTFAGPSGAAFLDVQWAGPQAFAAFVNAAGLSCACVYLAWGH